jgi:hypothetical protein
MLTKTSVIYQSNQSPQDDEPVRHVSGHYLAKNWLSARERAQLAADIIDRRATIDASTLTVGQISKICRANRIYVSEVRFPDRVKRRQQKKLAAIFDAIGADARAEVCRTVGVERVWNALVAAL